GRRIGGGSARAYYVGVETQSAERGAQSAEGGAQTAEGGERGAQSAERSAQSAGAENEQDAALRAPRPALSAPPRSALSILCVVPQHLEEGQEISLAKPELELA